MIGETGMVVRAQFISSFLEQLKLCDWIRSIKFRLYNISSSWDFFSYERRRRRRSRRGLLLSLRVIQASKTRRCVWASRIRTLQIFTLNLYGSHFAIFTSSDFRTATTLANVLLAQFRTWKKNWENGMEGSFHDKLSWHLNGPMCQHRLLFIKKWDPAYTTSIHSFFGDENIRNLRLT